MSTVKWRKSLFYWWFLYICFLTVKSFFLYSAALLLVHFGSGEKICRESKACVRLICSQFCEHVLQGVINPETVGVGGLHQTVLQGFVGIVSGGDGLYGFLPTQNKRQLSERAPTDDSFSNFYPWIYRKVRPVPKCLWTIQVLHISAWRGSNIQWVGDRFSASLGNVRPGNHRHQYTGIVPEKFSGVIRFPVIPVIIEDDRIFFWFSGAVDPHITFVARTPAVADHTEGSLVRMDQAEPVRSLWSSA